MNWKYQPGAAPANRSSAANARPQASERAALARLASATGHTLRLLRLSWASGSGAIPPDLADAEELLAKATLPEEYVEVSSRVGRLRAATALSGSNGLPREVFKRLMVGLRDLAHALDLEDILAEVKRLSEVSSEEPTVDPEPVLGVVRRTVTAVSSTREANEVLETCLREVEGGIRRLSADEEGSSARVQGIRKQLQHADALRDLDLLRGELIHETTEFERLIIERQQSLLRLERQARMAQKRAERVLAALADATTAASTDPLTSLGNRRALNEAARIAASTTSTTGVVLLDVDHFKKVNDTHGHAIGDRVLVHLSELLRGELRGDDQAFRIGGEEFVVLLAKCDERGAMATAERLRLRIAGTPLPMGNKYLPITSSFGVCLWGGGDSFDSILERADEALYECKRGGRNTVRSASKLGIPGG